MKFRHFFIYLLISVSTMTFSLYTVLGEAWPLITRVSAMYLIFMLGHYLYFYTARSNHRNRRKTDGSNGA